MLSRDDVWIWDFWLADDGERYHLFYLHAPKSLGDQQLRHRNARIGLATSTDLIDWSDEGLVLGPGETDDFDQTATWTGSVVRGPDDVWRMFYTGSRFLGEDPDVRNIESIGIATSTDLRHWRKQPDALLRADPHWYELHGTSGWREEAWRDPWVFADPTGDGWHMLITARSKHGDEDERGVIGHARSADLATWTVLAPLTDVGAGFAHLEVPQVVQIDGEWVLVFSADHQSLSAAGRASHATGGVWTTSIADPTDHYDIRSAAVALDDRLYSGRLVQDRTGAWVLLAFVNGDETGEFVGAITDPLPVELVPGRGVRLVAGRPASTRSVAAGDIVQQS